jgi:hypothetical protein
MRILFLDIYKNSFSRISKDTAGGYGTENNLGNSFFCKILSYIIKKTIFWPNLSFVQLFTEFKVRNYKVDFKTHIGCKPKVGSYDLIFVCNSIVCFEAEIDGIKHISSYSDAKFILCGTFAQFVQEKIPDNINILSGNYEFLFDYIRHSGTDIMESLKNRFLRIENGNPDTLSTIEWSSPCLNNSRNFILGNGKKYFPFIATRGCPYSCREYCTYPLAQGTKTSKESIDSTIKKLLFYSVKYKSSHIVFRDPVFSIDIRKSKDLLRKIGDAKLDLEFSAELHLKNVDDEFIELCKYANMKGLKFGIESAYQNVRDSVKRHSVNNDFQRSIIEKIRNAKIKTVGMFILVQPTDTLETCNGTIDYACSLDLDIAQFSIFTPYPGTPYYIKNQSKITEKRYSNYNQYSLVYKHNTITKNQARQILGSAYTKFITSKFKKKSFLDVFS